MYDKFSPEIFLQTKSSLAKKSIKCPDSSYFLHSEIYLIRIHVVINDILKDSYKGDIYIKNRSVLNTSHNLLSNFIDFQIRFIDL